MKYQPVIGVEIHCELLTDSKVFCSCKNEFGGEENTRVCPVCSGMPGALPMLNQQAVILAAKAGLCTDCTVNNYSAFDRKNYFYPDSPKAYQITQFEYPICKDGYIAISNKKVRINRIHIEEDAGKLIHDDKNGVSVIDYNRCGVPLIEIVTEPDFSSASEVCEFVEQLALRLKYCEVCDAKMEQGSLRVDVNISIMPVGSNELGTRAEIKNLNSFKSITKAIEYEISRQSEVLDKGGRVIQETRRFDDSSNTTSSLRSKEEAHDYRYFPEPDIPPIIISDKSISDLQHSLPELPHIRYKRYTDEYGLSEDDAMLIINSKAFSDFYDDAVKHNPDYKSIASMMLVEVNRNLNNNNMCIEDVCFTPKDIAQLAKMVSDGVVSKNTAKDILKIMFLNGENPLDIANKNGYIMSNDTNATEEIIDNLLRQNPRLVQDYKNGSEKIFGYFMGQAMRTVGKSANPATVREILIKKLNQ